MRPSAPTRSKTVPNWIALAVYCLLGFQGLLPPPSHGQDLGLRRVFGRYQQYLWQDQHGLPENSVNAVRRTRDGYLWLGTEFGLYRFDGVRALRWQPPAGEHRG